MARSHARAPTMLSVTLAAVVLSQGAGLDPAPCFGPREAEHLLNRAGFGATTAEVEAWVELGLEGAVERLLDPPPGAPAWQDIEPSLVRYEDFGRTHRFGVVPDSPWYDMTDEQHEAMYFETGTRERAQFFELERRIFDAVHAGHDPLRYRLLLFWHGFFATSGQIFKRKFELIRQCQWLRANAVESYAELLHGLVRDPAMLNYLDNSSNFAGHANENFARELMELHSLGEGNFSERDVREAARALTGHAGASDGTYEFLAEEHDDGQKTILGVTGAHDAADLVQLLLAHEACAPYVARRLLVHFEGRAPDEARLESYARTLRDADYALQPFLRRLFSDPAFYSEDVVGLRVTPPIEWLLGCARRLEVPLPATFVHLAGSSMGQVLYRPPSVKGWSEGPAWLGGDALFKRGNSIGLLCDTLEGRLSSQLVETRRELDGAHWSPAERLLPRLRAAPPPDCADLAGRLAEDWLAIEPPRDVVEWIERALADELAARGLELSEWLSRDDLSAPFLRRLAHFVHCLPEAQLS